jgi:exonuclease SbcD
VHYKNDEIDYERMIIPVDENTCCLAVPYLRHNDLPTAESYSEGIAKFYSELYNIAKQRYSTIIAMGHLQASGAEVSVGDNSEHAIIGGMEGIDSSFANEGIAYFALGHLHRAQRVSGRENVRYSGAPLPMSFAERNNRQSVTEVVIENGKTSIEKLFFDTPVKLLSIPDSPKPLDEVLPLLESLKPGEITTTSPFLEIRIIVTEYDPAIRAKIEEALAGKDVRLARIEAVSENKDGEQRVITYEDFKKASPDELMQDIYRRRNGKDLPETLKILLDEIIKEATE